MRTYLRQVNEPQGIRKKGGRAAKYVREAREMAEGKVYIYGGTGHGKSPAALGCGLIAAAKGAHVVIIQFLRGKGLTEDSYARRLEPEIKLFRFEKSDCDFFALSEEKRKEEIHNIRNGLNFAKKVLTTGECDLLVLDEVLELVGNSIIGEDDLKNVLEARGEYTDVILTGAQAPEGIREMADAISEIHRAR